MPQSEARSCHVSTPLVRAREWSCVRLSLWWCNASRCAEVFAWLHGALELEALDDLHAAGVPIGAPETDEEAEIQLQRALKESEEMSAAHAASVVDDADRERAARVAQRLYPEDGAKHASAIDGRVAAKHAKLAEEKSNREAKAKKDTPNRKWRAAPPGAKTSASGGGKKGKKGGGKK